MTIAEFQAAQRHFLIRLWRHYRQGRRYFNRRDAYRTALALTRKHMT